MTEGNGEGRGPLQSSSYHVERLDDVSTRLARIEGQLQHVAFKSDLEHAKYLMMVTWVAIGVSVIVGAATLARLFFIG